MGKSRKVYIVGEKYGREGIILLEELQFEKNGYTKGRFRCTCGKEFVARITAITGGNSIGCGCRIGENLITHDLTSHPMYNTFTNIISRCYNPNHHRYKYYGGRGITMSDEFRYDTKAFIEYIISLPNYERRIEDKLSLDRKENSGIYERGNLRWATQTEQVNNSRKIGIGFILEDD